MDIYPTHPPQERAFAALLLTITILVSIGLHAPWMVVVSASIVPLILVWLYIVQPYLSSFTPEPVDTGDEVGNALVDFTQRQGDARAYEAQAAMLRQEMRVLHSRLDQLIDEKDKEDARRLVDSVDPSIPGDR